MNTTNYESISIMLREFGCDSIRILARHLFKRTDCGVSVSFHLGNCEKIHSSEISDYQNTSEFAARNIVGIQLHSICEGSEAEFSSKVLFFPMHAQDFQDAVDKIECEVDDLWQEINGQEE